MTKAGFESRLDDITARNSTTMKDEEPDRLMGLTIGKKTTIQPVFKKSLELTQEEKDTVSKKIKIEVVDEAEKQLKSH